MQNTTQAYKDAVYGISRRTVARVTFDITDTTAYDDVSSVSASTNAASQIGNVNQVADRQRSQTYNLATYEQDRIKLDGSFTVPDDNGANNGEMGWVTGVLSDNEGDFAGPNIIGAAGNCEDISLWSNSGGTIALDTTNKVSGTAGIKCTLTTPGLGYANFYRNGANLPIDKARYYILLGELKCGTCSLARLKSVVTGGAGNVFGTNVFSTSAFQTSYVLLSPAQMTGGTTISVNAQFDGADNSYGYADNLRAYEITPEEYTLYKSGAWTAAQLSAKYPMSTTAAFPVLTINFNANHSSAGLTVAFDVKGGTYATDYGIAAYDSTGAVIDSAIVTGNTNVIDQPLAQLLNYRKVTVTIKRWSKPNYRGRVTEVDFGIVKVYDGDTLIRAGLDEELMLDSSSVPSSEFSFTADNSDRKFNILNPTGFYKYLQQRQKITAEMGVELTPGGAVEWLPYGMYYLNEWVSDEGSMTASFTARSMLDIMAGYASANTGGWATNLYDFAVTLFTTCGIPERTVSKPGYYMDPSLKTILTPGIVENVTNYKDLMQQIAIAACCVIEIGRDGSIILTPPNLTLVGGSDDSITSDNTYNLPQITLDKPVKQVNVTYWTSATVSGGVSTWTAGSVTDGDILTMDNNKLIGTAARALAVATWIGAARKFRAKFSINWRGNPAHELGDKVAVENGFGTDQQTLLTKHTMTYEGFLKFNTESRGIPT